MSSSTDSALGAKWRQWLRDNDDVTRGRSEERRVGKEGRSRCDWSSDVCSSDLVCESASRYPCRARQILHWEPNGGSGSEIMMMLQGGDRKSTRLNSSHTVI